MGRHGWWNATRKGAHRSESENVGALRRLGGLIGSTVPKRVEPPRLLNVLVISGVLLGLLLFGYSTTQIYLQFGEDPDSSEGPNIQDGARPSDEASPRSEGEETGGGDGPWGPRTQAGSSPTTVAYQMVESTSTGFTGHVTVTNTSRTKLDAWELALAFDSAEVTDVDDADWESIEGGILARQPGGRDGLAPGESSTFTFKALGAPQSPSRCSLNGHICEL